MPLIYNLRTQSHQQQHSSRHHQTPSTVLHAQDVDDDIVLSDLVRGTGEASRLRRRGALRVDRMDHSQGAAMHYPVNAHLNMTLPSPPGSSGGPVGDGGNSSASANGIHTGRPSRWEVFAPYEEDSMSRSQSQSRVVIVPPTQLPHTPPQQPSLVLPFPVAPPLDLGVSREGGSDEDYNGYTYVLRCGRNNPDSDSEDYFSSHSSSASSTSCPFVPSILPLFPSRTPASTTPSSFTKQPSSSKRRLKRTHGCGAIVHTKAAPRPKSATWSAKTEAPPSVVHLDSSYFDGAIVDKIIRSSCGCVREGVGCAVCGNPLGTLYIPCKTATEGIFSSRSRSRRSQPSSQTQSQSSSTTKLHVYSFFSSAVSSSPSFQFPTLSSPPATPSSPSTSPSSPDIPVDSSTTSSLPIPPSYPSYSAHQPHPAFGTHSMFSPPSMHSAHFQPTPSSHTPSQPPSHLLPHPSAHLQPSPHRPWLSRFRVTSFSSRSDSSLPELDSESSSTDSSDIEDVRQVRRPRQRVAMTVGGTEREEDRAAVRFNHLPVRSLEHLPPPMTRTYSTYGPSAGTSPTTGFFFGRFATASPVPLSDVDDNDGDRAEDNDGTRERVDVQVDVEIQRRADFGVGPSGSAIGTLGGLDDGTRGSLGNRADDEGPAVPDVSRNDPEVAEGERRVNEVFGRLDESAGVRAEEPPPPSSDGADPNGSISASEAEVDPASRDKVESAH